eukprot:744804-Prymnesium_polylepis.1
MSGPGSAAGLFVRAFGPGRRGWGQLWARLLGWACGSRRGPGSWAYSLGLGLWGEASGPGLKASPLGSLLWK